MLRFAFAVAIAALWSGGAHAQSYPSRQINIVVTFPPGGNADVTARLLADRLSQAFKQTVIVENRPGAATIPGTSAVLQAPADGYTLLEAGTNTNINPILGNKTPYDAERDLVPVALLVTVPAVLVVNAGSSGEQCRRAYRAGEGEAWRTELRLGWQRHLRASCDGAVHAVDRHEDHACAVQGPRAIDDGAAA